MRRGGNLLHHAKPTGGLKPLQVGCAGGRGANITVHVRQKHTAGMSNEAQTMLTFHHATATALPHDQTKDDGVPPPVDPSLPLNGLTPLSSCNVHARKKCSATDTPKLRLDLFPSENGFVVVSRIPQNYAWIYSPLRMGLQLYQGYLKIKLYFP